MIIARVGVKNFEMFEQQTGNSKNFKAINLPDKNVILK